MFSKKPSLHYRRQVLKNAIQEGIDSGIAENFGSPFYRWCLEE